jgi:hypothetical protein
MAGEKRKPTQPTLFQSVKRAASLATSLHLFVFASGGLGPRCPASGEFLHARCCRCRGECIGAGFNARFFLLSVAYDDHAADAGNGELQLAACDPCAAAVEAHPRYPRVCLVDAASGTERPATVDAVLREND